ncbi:MAG: C4-type zinc ribbon domain-containing protein [bacterium]
MKDSLKQLLDLQQKDLYIDSLTEELEDLPVEIENLKSELEVRRKEFEDFKKENNQRLVGKKSKEGELDGKEKEIIKHNQELNTVKTNEAYRAILKEIDKCKQQKDILEEEILTLMEGIDTFNKEVKKREQGLKKDEADSQRKIGELENTIKSKTLERETKIKECGEFSKTINGAALQRYQYIRKAEKGTAVVPINNNMCGGCHMELPPHTLNVALTNKDLVICETCSRILYTEKAVKDAES